MKWEVSPSKLHGTITIPPSKSQSMRALLFALLAKGRSRLYDLLPSPEMIRTCRLLGAQVEEYQDRIEIVGLNGRVEGAGDIIDAGNSGLIFRFIGAVAALSSKPIVLTGDHSVRHNRPIQPLLDGLTQLGAKALSLPGNGRGPILVEGPLRSGSATLDGEDSQPVSALLIATAFSQGEFELFVQNPGELPWIQLTLEWLKRFNIPCQARGGEHYHIQGGNAIEGFTYRAPGDFSSLAFPLAAALLTHSSVTFENLNFQDPQGDKRLIAILQEMGASIEIEGSTLHVKKGGPLCGIKIDLNDCIDALPILAVIGCFAEGETELVGGKIARKKECDRISAIACELRKMGAKIEEREDGLVIQRSDLKGASALYSYHDHRMALSLAVAALAASGKSQIDGVECVSKTFPLFQKQMQNLGADIK